MNVKEILFLNSLEDTIIAFTNGLYAEGVIDLVTPAGMRDALSSGQLLSKKWLVSELMHHLEDQIFIEGVQNIVVVGGWWGLLAHAIGDQYGILTVDSLDICPKATRVAASTLAESNGNAILGDMYDFDYSKYKCVVNTSAEHIADLPSWIDLVTPGTFVAVQSNNARHVPDHVSCVDSADELKALLGLSEVFYADELDFPMYTRYMVIGRK